MARFFSVLVLALVSALASLCSAQDAFPCGAYDIRLPGSDNILGYAVSYYLQTKEVEYVRFQFEFATEELDAQYKFEIADAHFGTQFSDFKVSDKKNRLPIELFDFADVPLEQSQSVTVDYPIDILPEQLFDFKFAMRVGYTSKNEGVEHNDHAWVTPIETRTDLWNKAENLPVYCDNFDYAGSIVSTSCVPPLSLCNSDYSTQNTGSVSYTIPGGWPYMNNELCTFTIYPDEPFSLLHLNFTYLSTEEGYDFVSIYEIEGNLIQTYSGELPEGGIQITTPYAVQIIFSTDGEGRSLGYELEWTTELTDD